MGDVVDDLFARLLHSAQSKLGTQMRNFHARVRANRESQSVVEMRTGQEKKSWVGEAHIVTRDYIDREST